MTPRDWLLSFAVAAVVCPASVFAAAVTWSIADSGSATGPGGMTMNSGGTLGGTGTVTGWNRAANYAFVVATATSLITPLDAMEFTLDTNLLNKSLTSYYSNDDSNWPVWPSGNSIVLDYSTPGSSALTLLMVSGLALLSLFGAAVGAKPDPRTPRRAL